MHNRNALHCKLYETSGPRHVIRKTQKMLAVELAMSQFTLNRIMSEMVQDGRLKILGKGSHACKTYIVRDPVEWNVRNHLYMDAEFARESLGRYDDPYPWDEGPAKLDRGKQPLAEAAIKDVSDDPELAIQPVQPTFTVEDIFFGVTR